MKRFLLVPFLFLAVGLAYVPPPSATSQPLPITHVAKSLPAQTKDELKVEGAGIKDVEKVVMVPKVVIVTTVQSFPFTVTAPAGAGLYFWTYPPLLPVVDRNDSIEVTSAPKGDLSISVKAIYVDLDKDGKFKGFKTKFYSTKLTVGEVPPGPVPPDPGPNPPVPPTPTPAPINEPGLHVLFIYETADLSKYPQGQVLIFNSATFRDWLDQVCTNGTGAYKKAWRMYDKDTTMQYETKPWQDAMKLPRTQLPWLIISNPTKGGYQGPLPATIEETKTLIQKYIGGN